MPSFSYDFPYASKKLPIFAANVVASSQHLAATAGLRMLAKGGNAVDAAIASAIAITVVEPTKNGIGADAFCILWDGSKLVGLNASGHSPALMTPDQYKGQDKMPSVGWGSVSTPGAVSLWIELHKRYGKLPFADLFEPAIKYASDGYRVSYMVSRQWERAIDRLKGQESWVKAFLPDGRAPKPGELWKFPDQARTLTKIAESKGEAFYRGELAEAMDKYARETGGALRKEDLAAHQPDWVDPIGLTYRGTTLHEIPPSGQGIAACMALGILENFDVAGHDADGPEVAHLRIEAMKLAFADIWRYVADPRFMEVTPAQMLDKQYLKSRARLIDPRKAKDFGPGVPKDGGTIYLGTADASGMMVSLIQSNYTGFGSGIVVPGTGIALQNRATGFVTTKGHANEVGPKKRPFHTIIPAFITKDGKPVATFGLMGGAMQPQGHMQVFSRIVDYGQNPQAAIDAPALARARDRRHGVDRGAHAGGDRSTASRRAATRSRAPSGRASISARARSSGASPTAAPISAPPKAAATARPSGSDVLPGPRASRPAHAHWSADLPGPLMSMSGPGGPRSVERSLEARGRDKSHDHRRLDRQRRLRPSTARRPIPAVSWKGHRIEGLLFNSRMANAIADDENPATRGAWAYADGDWDAERSTREFIAALPAYRAHGLLAVCLNLQGGSPQGYSWHQPWKICGFTPDGAIKPAWAARLASVIAACDRLGMVVILGLFYGKQSGTLKDESGGEGRRHQHRRLAARARRHQRADRDRQRGRPRERRSPIRSSPRRAATS